MFACQHSIIMKSFISVRFFLALLSAITTLKSSAFVPAIRTPRRNVTTPSSYRRRQQHRPNCYDVDSSFLLQRHNRVNKKQLYQTTNTNGGAADDEPPNRRRWVPGQNLDKLLNKLFDKADTNRVSSTFMYNVRWDVAPNNIESITLTK